MSASHLVILTLALLATGCSARASGPPHIVVDRTVCSHCGMLVSESAYAAAYQAHDNEARVFDDIGCLLTAIRHETASPITVWLQDAAGAGWIRADEATLVTSPRIRTPMSGGVLAYADAARAQQAAAAHDGRVMRSLAEIETWNGDGK